MGESKELQIQEQLALEREMLQPQVASEPYPETILPGEPWPRDAREAEQILTNCPLCGGLMTDDDYWCERHRTHD